MMSREMVCDAKRVADARHPITSPLRILFTGRLSPDKNVDVLLDAMRLLCDSEHRDYELRVVGNGPEMASLQQHTRDIGLCDRVEFVGSVPYDSVGPYYANADVLVLASESEGWPKSLTEGMAYGMAATSRSLLQRTRSG